MGILPPLPQLAASVSADIAKVFLDRHGWDRLAQLIRAHGLVPASGAGRTAAAAAAFVANGIMDWHLAEDTPAARFTKELLRDLPSEMVGRLASARATELPGDQHPLYRMSRADREALLDKYRRLESGARNRLRGLLAGLSDADLTVLATASEEDLGSLLDLLAPPASAGHPPAARRIAAALDGFTAALFPFMGKEERKPS